jgi:hypothetical protein
MNGTRRLYLPMFGIALILSIVAASAWFSGGKTFIDGLILGGAIVLVWILFIIVRRRRA